MVHGCTEDYCFHFLFRQLVRRKGIIHPRHPLHRDNHNLGHRLVLHIIHRRRPHLRKQMRCNRITVASIRYPHPRSCNPHLPQGPKHFPLFLKYKTKQSSHLNPPFSYTWNHYCHPLHPPTGHRLCPHKPVECSSSPQVLSDRNLLRIQVSPHRRCGIHSQPLQRSKIRHLRSPRSCNNCTPVRLPTLPPSNIHRVRHERIHNIRTT